ncbi:MAG: hypothetical protein V7K96_26380 [Nostoc sp.]
MKRHGVQLYFAQNEGAIAPLVPNKIKYPHLRRGLWLSLSSFFNTNVLLRVAIDSDYTSVAMYICVVACLSIIN